MPLSRSSVCSVVTRYDAVTHIVFVRLSHLLSKGRLGALVYSQVNLSLVWGNENYPL